MSLFRCSASIINHIEKLQRDFLWQGKETKKNIIWWIGEQFALLRKVGLDFRPMRDMDNALLGEWLRRIGEDIDSVCKNAILTKYGVRRDGWDVNGPSFCFFRLKKE